MNRAIAAAVLLWASAAHAATVAFPGAEGFGAGATGGRGGQVYHVTTLADSGDGSLRDAVSQSNRTVVFDVGGVIHVKSQIALSNNLTVAGQTAPGGIAIFGGGISLSKRNNIIIRYLTVRSGIKTARGSKSLSVLDGSNIMLDHLSIGWGRWDNCGFTGACHDITMQNCLIEEAIKDQQFGMLVDDAHKITFARNLFSNNHARNPKGKGDLQYINNVIYNWGNQGYGGGHSGAPWNEDLIGNYMIAGPDSDEKKFFSFLTANDLVYSEGNYIDENKDGALNGRPWTVEDVTVQTATPAAKPFNVPAVPVTVTSAKQAVADIIAGVGNSLHRDSVDLRQIEQLQSFGKLGKNPADENEVGGMPVAPPSPKATIDQNQDGIADEWEAAHHVTAADANKVAASGYTPLEEYLNALTIRPKS